MKIVHIGNCFIEDCDEEEISVRDKINTDRSWFWPVNNVKEKQ